MTEKLKVNLLDHNLIVYENLKDALKNSNLVMLTSCPGSGKSFVLLKLLEDFPGPALIICPKRSIQGEWKRNADKYGVMVDTATYHGISNMSEMQLACLAEKYKYFVFDECHHIGAEKWQKNINFIKDTFSENIFIGLTATPVRYLDGGNHVGFDFFGGNIVCGKTQAEAIEEGILPGFRYVCGLFANLDRIKKLKDLAEKYKDDLLCTKLNRLEYSAQNIDEVFNAFDKYMPEGDRKGIVFVDRISNVKKAMSVIREYFGDDELYVYIDSSRAFKENSSALESFRSARSGWLFAVDMLNEGVHIPGVNTIVMFRKTISPNLYIQQLGRSQSSGASEAVIFDFMGNRNNLKSLGLSPTADSCGNKMQYKSDPRVIVDYYETGAVKLLNEIERSLDPYKKWTPEENRLFVELYPKKGGRWCAEYFGVSISAIWLHAQALGVHPEEFWTDEKKEFVISNYPEKGGVWCAKQLGVTATTVYNFAKKETISRIPAWTNEQIQFVIENYNEYGTNWCAEKLGISTDAVRGMVERLKKKGKLSSTLKPYWTREDKSWLAQHYNELTAQECASYLDRTISAVEAMAKRLHLKKRVPALTEAERKNLMRKWPEGGKKKSSHWSEEDKLWLKQHYQDLSEEQCAQHLGRSMNSIKMMIYRLKNS